MADRAFHGFTAVAELKPLCATVCDGSFSSFHGFTAVAELKHHSAIFHRDIERTLSTASPPWPN